MKKFVPIYHGYETSTPEVVAAWNDWVRRRVASFVDVGNPFGPGREIAKNTVIEWSLASNPASGYSIVNAPNIDFAEQLLEGCPIVDSVSLYEALPARARPAGEPGFAEPPATRARQEEIHQLATTHVVGRINREEVHMSNIKVERTVAAPRSSVWAVLADYPNIVDWNDNIKNSYAIGDATEGVGAQRQTELAPDGAMRMRETVTEWLAGERMVVAIDEIEMMPVKSATQTFTLADGGETTSFAMSYDYEPIGEPLGPMFDEQMSMGFNGFIDSLERAAQARTAT